MSLFSSKSQSVFQYAERQLLTPPDEEMPMGYCPWCGTKLMKSSETEWTGYPFCPKLWCKEYDSLTDERGNRKRFERESKLDLGDEH